MSKKRCGIFQTLYLRGWFFFKFGMEFLRHLFLLSKFFCRNSYSRKYYPIKCRKNSVLKNDPVVRILLTIWPKFYALKNFECRNFSIFVSDKWWKITNVEKFQSATMEPIGKFRLSKLFIVPHSWLLNYFDSRKKSIILVEKILSKEPMCRNISFEIIHAKNVLCYSKNLSKKFCVHFFKCRNFSVVIFPSFFPSKKIHRKRKTTCRKNSVEIPTFCQAKQLGGKKTDTFPSSTCAQLVLCEKGKCGLHGSFRKNTL